LTLFTWLQKKLQQQKNIAKSNRLVQYRGLVFPCFLLWNFYLFIYFQFKVLIEKKKDEKKERKEEKGLRKGKRLEKRISNILY